jgi:hypothetical protein
MRARFFACLALVFSPAGAAAATITVPAGGDLQAAIGSAQPGDTIVLAPGAVYVGSFTLYDKIGDAPITIRTAELIGQPGAGRRILPAHAPLLAKIRTNTNQPAIQTAANAHHWRLTLLEIQSGPNASGEIVALGDATRAQTTLDGVPYGIVLDRVYVHADAQTGRLRGIALNSASTTIMGSYVSDIKAIGQDSQAIAGWNGPGPYTIVNNYLEAAGENLLFGGADPQIPDLVPADITVADNDLVKPASWRGQRWSIKNLLELKNARRVTIVRNTLEHNWLDAQTGYAILFTVRNQDGRCGWCQVDHVRFERNVVRDVAAGIQILGVDNNHPSRQTQAIEIRNNVFARIDTERWGGNGYFLSLSGGPRDITIDHNTILQDHALGLVQVDGPPVLGFTFTNNVAKHHSFGFIGSDHGVGNDSIRAYFPASTIARNVIAGGNADRYPGDNSFPGVGQFEAQFESYSGGDYRLVAGSAWRNAGIDGRDLGAAMSAPDRRPPSLRDPPSRDIAARRDAAPVGIEHATRRGHGSNHGKRRSRIRIDGRYKTA